jgi:hypothetical protein
MKLNKSKTTAKNFILKDKITANKIKNNRVKILLNKQIKMNKNLNFIKYKTQKKLTTNFRTFGLKIMIKVTKLKLKNKNHHKLRNLIPG